MNTKTLTVSQALHRAAAYQKSGQFAKAEQLYRQILQVEPQQPQALHLLGVLATQAGQYAAAVSLIQRAVATGKASPVCFGDLGHALTAQEQWAAATQAYTQAVRQQPELMAQYGHHLAHTLKKQGLLSQAIQCYQNLLQGDLPKAEIIYNNLANIYKQQGQLEYAIQHYQQALKLKPDYLNAHNNLANTYKEQGQLSLAIQHYQQALTLHPQQPELHNNLGTLFQAQGQLTQALLQYDKALSLNPQLITIHNNKARIFLTRGDWAQGWREHLWRPPRQAFYARLQQTPPTIKPLPTTLTQQHILLEAEQGLGDELFFLRFAPLLKQRGAQISYRYANPKIVCLLQQQAWLDQLLAPQEEIRDHAALQLLIGDLPLALEMTTTEQIPPPLSFSARQKAQLQQQLRQLGPPPYIGLTWRAGTPIHETTFTGNTYKALSKEIELTVLAAALETLEATFIALQRHPYAAELETLAQRLKHPVHDFTALNEDLIAMLALLALLDDYIGVSNTNLYLMAGLGKTARVLVPNPPDWRWMAQGTESPWFAGFKIYRQNAAKQWSLEALTTDLMQR